MGQARWKAGRVQSKYMLNEIGTIVEHGQNLGREKVETYPTSVEKGDT